MQEASCLYNSAYQLVVNKETTDFLIIECIDCMQCKTLIKNDLANSLQQDVHDTNGY